MISLVFMIMVMVVVMMMMMEIEVVLKISFPTQRPIQKKQKEGKPAFYVCINFAKGTTTVPNNASQRDHNGP